MITIRQSSTNLINRKVSQLKKESNTHIKKELSGNAKNQERTLQMDNESLPSATVLEQDANNK